jgi:hypothetical protein
VKLAYKVYTEDTDPTMTVTCCNCLKKRAEYYSLEGGKADDCKDIAHNTVCWLCRDCLLKLGAHW